MKTNLKIFNLSAILLVNSASNKNSIWESIIKFYNIWPPFQWATSLFTLVFLYWVSGYFYNKFLSQKGGWMSSTTRIYMIIIDLLLNFSLGIYYMNYRDTLIGTLLVQCPVFCSPFFWLMELVFFYIYYRYFYLISIKKINSEWKNFFRDYATNRQSNFSNYSILNFYILFFSISWPECNLFL